MMSTDDDHTKGSISEEQSNNSTDQEIRPNGEHLPQSAASNDDIDTHVVFTAAPRPPPPIPSYFKSSALPRPSSETKKETGPAGHLKEIQNLQGWWRQKKAKSNQAIQQKASEKYQPLYNAALKGGWEIAKEFFIRDKDAITAGITMFSETALHVAAKAGHVTFVMELIELMPSHALVYPEKNSDDTELHRIAIAGITEAAKAVVKKNPISVQIRNKKGWSPLLSAIYGSSNQQREMIEYLIKASKTNQKANQKTPFTSGVGEEVICTLTRAGFFDIAANLIQDHPYLAIEKDKDGNSVLEVLAEMRYAFPSGSCLKTWQRYIYPCIVDVPDVRQQHNKENTPAASDGILTTRNDLPDAHQQHKENPPAASVGKLPDAQKQHDEENPPAASDGISTTRSDLPDAQQQQDEENAPATSDDILTTRRWIKFILMGNLTEVFQRIKKQLPEVHCIKKIREEKKINIAAQRLVNCIVNGLTIDKSSDENSSTPRSSYDISEFFKDSSIFSKVTTYGTIEVIENCVHKFPDMIWLKMKGRNIFEIAIEERHEKIFMLVHEMNEHKKDLIYLRDDSGNNILHLAAKLSSASNQLQPVYCEALQMQIELQWFKEVETIALPIHKLLRNKDGKTPLALFTEQHRDLMNKAEQWMKGTANSCMLVATLIATVMFAAVFTVPGGIYSGSDSRDIGIPIFLYRNSFILFVVADAVSLFSSTTSVLVFLTILNSRYAAEDFLKALPEKLIIGFSTLFISIATMLIAFSATLYIALERRFGWIPVIPIVALASLPIISFVSLQIPLFVDLCYTTYGRSIFHRKRH